MTYTYDEANRQKSIIGTNYSITQFVNSVFYRAWNVPREVTFGNTRKLTMAHNQRLSVTHMEMELQGSLPPAIDKDYEYNNDNRLKYSGDNIDPRYDRAFNYDQSRRLNKALSGAEARGSSTTDDRPYNQFANYDAFDHRTVLNSRHWSKTFPYITSDSFLNNRRTGWQYDANGNILNDLHRTFTYDAASRLVASSGGSVTQVFDGDGRRVKTTDQFGTTYYLSSSVLSEVVAELDNAGNRSLGFIYALGDVLAEESANGFISFVHKDASRLSVRKTHPTLGVLMEATELDPQGADVELEDPYLNEPDYDGRAEGAPLYPGYANVTSAGTCTVGGIWMPCDMAYRMFPQQVGTRDWGVFRLGIDPLDPFGPFGPIDWHPGFLRWLEENNRVLTSRNYLELGREWFSNLLAEQKSIDWSVLHSSLTTCIHALWPMFEMTSFKPTSSPPKKLGKNHDQYNGVIGLTDLAFGTTFNVTNDPTPSAVDKALLISRGARGLTDSGNPFWTYSHPAADPTPRPGELRYPELFGQISMDYIRVQIHETGAALSLIRNAYHPGPWALRLPDGGLDPTHDDDGPSLEDCVGREYYKQLKLTPHKYP